MVLRRPEADRLSCQTLSLANTCRFSAPSHLSVLTACGARLCNAPRLPFSLHLIASHVRTTLRYRLGRSYGTGPGWITVLCAGNVWDDGCC